METGVLHESTGPRILHTAAWASLFEHGNTQAFMEKKYRKELRAYTVRVLLSRHPEIRRLKNRHAPTVHGNKNWSSSWLLIDYLHHKGLPLGSRVLEIGCGWGLAGIYCAKKYGAEVTGIDVDRDVFPFLQLHANINKVEVATRKKNYAHLTVSELSRFDLLIGSDICFWESMIDPLIRLIRRAIKAGVREVLIADPGRTTFDKVCKHFSEKETGEVLEWTTRKPRPLGGFILRVHGT